MTKLAKRDLWVPASLLALSLVPIVGGVVRVLRLASGSVSAEDVKFHTSPAPVSVHIASASVYALLGAFQFSSGFRRRWPTWHRRAGGVLIACGFLVAASGVWMAALYPIPTSLQGPTLYWMRLAVGVAMATSLVKGLLAIRRRDVVEHEAWMIRAYALAQGAGTQALLFLPVILLSGPVLGTPRDVLLSTAWLMNLAFAEWLIRRRSLPAERPATVVTASRAVV